ncbi:hypothetical protein JCM3766R1_002165 [Sporobolomyces carnicolor]
MTISQEKVAKMLESSSRPEETEEVLLAYCFSKWMNGGNQAQVLRKLHLLTLYLRAVDLGHVLRQHYQAFAIVASLTKNNSGPVVLLPTTALGLEAWNAARRPSKSVLKRVFFDASSKRSSRSRATTTTSSESSSEVEDNNQVSNAQDDEVDDSATITPANPAPSANRNRSGSGGGGGALASFMSGRRSRSNTTTSATIVVNPGEQGEQTRRMAGTGARDGLGRGLLSAPPNYDGNLTSYLASSPNSESSLNVSLDFTPRQPHAEEPALILRDEVEALPGYA